jgi:succinate dehydrogenase/fumarate reductase flavoprotein subunit
LAGLYAAGSLASLYHGSCQLGGNRLLADLFGGCVAARAAQAYVQDDAPDGAAEEAVEEVVAASEQEHGDRVEGGFGAAHLELIAMLRDAVIDILGTQERDLGKTAEQIDSAEAELSAMPPETRAGSTGAAQLHALESMLLVGQFAAHTVVEAAAHPREGRLLSRLVDDEIVVSDELRSDGRTISGSIDDDGIRSEPRDYGSSS